MLDCTAAWARGRPGSEVLRTAVPGEDLFGDTPSGTVATRETLVLTRSGLEVPARVAATRLPDGSVVLVVRDLTL